MIASGTRKNTSSHSTGGLAMTANTRLARFQSSSMAQLHYAAIAAPVAGMKPAITGRGNALKPHDAKIRVRVSSNRRERVRPSNSEVSQRAMASAGGKIALLSR